MINHNQPPQSEFVRGPAIKILRYIENKLEVPEMNSLEDLGHFSKESGLLQIMRAAVETHGQISRHHNYGKTLVGTEKGPDNIVRPFYTSVHNRITEDGDAVPYLFHAYATGGSTPRTTRSMLIPLEDNGELNLDRFARQMVNWHIANQGTIKLEYYVNNLRRIAGLMAEAIELKPPKTTIINLDGLISLSPVTLEPES
jgi:hypothetical protein